MTFSIRIHGQKFFKTHFQFPNHQSFRRAQTILAGIELVHMIRKGQLQHPAGNGLTPVEQFYLLAA